MKNPLQRIKAEPTASSIQRGEVQLNRIMIVIDVLYALMIFQLFLLMPNPSVDNFTASELVAVFRQSYLNYTVMIIGIVLILLYWGQNHLVFGNLLRTDGTLSVIAILQAFFLMLYLYFVRLEMEMEGQRMLLQLQSVFLAIAGGMSLWAWHYANIRNLVSDVVSDLERDKTYLKLMPEPVTAALTFPFAYLGPGIWSLSWLLIMPMSYILKRVRKRMKERKT